MTVVTNYKYALKGGITTQENKKKIQKKKVGKTLASVLISPPGSSEPVIYLKHGHIAIVS